MSTLEKKKQMKMSEMHFNPFNSNSLIPATVLENHAYMNKYVHHLFLDVTHGRAKRHPFPA